MFEAQHERLERKAWIRLLGPHDFEEVAARERFFEEARLLDAARHRAVITVLDAAPTADGEPYLATEALEGRPLDGVLEVRDTLSIDEAVSVALDLGDALSHAHDLGIIHRGLCAGSVLWTEPARGERERGAKLLDFGVSPCPTSVLSGPLAAMGYASPERLSGAPPDRASDVYALGALLFEMLCGRLPSRGSEPSPLALREAIPESLDAVVRTALAPATTRYGGMQELTGALREVTAVQPLPPSEPPARRRAHPRAGYVTPVRMRRDGGELFDGRTEDISEGGVLVLTSGQAHAGESVLLRFALPMSGRLVSVPANIRWARETRGERVALGVSFEDPGDRVLEEVRAYVGYLGSEL